jgi:hypothetical protein
MHTRKELSSAILHLASYEPLPLSLTPCLLTGIQKELDQELALEEDEENFNPDVELRDYEQVAQSLPVFCVSSRGYQVCLLYLWYSVRFANSMLNRSFKGVCGMTNRFPRSLVSEKLKSLNSKPIAES